MTKASQATPLRDLVVRRHSIVLHGREVSYLSAGSGPPLTLLHGIASNAETWRKVLPLLARRFQVIAPDLPGHGESDKAPGDYSLGSLASTVRDLLISLGLERSTIVGHSLGGGLAMQFAYLFPDRCERLVLISSGGLGREVSLLLRAATLPGSELVIGATVTPIASAGRWAGNLLGKVGLHPMGDVGEVGRSFTSLADTDGRAAFLATLRAVVDIRGQRINAGERLYLAAELPTMLVWGERDPIIPVRHGRRAAQLIAGSELLVFAKSGHFPHLDEPHRFADSLLEFTTATKAARVSARQWGELLRNAPQATTKPGRANTA